MDVALAKQTEKRAKEIARERGMDESLHELFLSEAYNEVLLDIQKNKDEPKVAS